MSSADTPNPSTLVHADLQRIASIITVAKTSDPVSSAYVFSQTVRKLLDDEWARQPAHSCKQCDFCALSTAEVLEHEFTVHDLRLADVIRQLLGFEKVMSTNPSIHPNDPVFGAVRELVLQFSNSRKPTFASLEADFKRFGMAALQQFVGQCTPDSVETALASFSIDEGNLKDALAHLIIRFPLDAATKNRCSVALLLRGVIDSMGFIVVKMTTLLRASYREVTMDDRIPAHDKLSPDSLESRKHNHERRKFTTKCKRFHGAEGCKSEDCQFVHDVSNLREMPAVCRQYYSEGFCNWGDECGQLHLRSRKRADKKKSATK